MPEAGSAECPNAEGATACPHTPDELAARLVRRFASRTTDPVALARLAEAVVASHGAEDFEAQSARLAVRAAPILHPPTVTSPASSGSMLPVTRPEMRLLRGPDVAGDAPPHVHEGLPVRGESLPLDHETVVEWWREYLERRRSGLSPRPIYVYAHFPYCRSRCRYCYTDSLLLGDGAGLEPYLADLEVQAGAFQRDLGRLDVDIATIGGGTPSLLEVPQMRRMLDAIVGRAFELRPGGYFSFEMHPATTTVDKLRLVAEYGVNRVSLGAQSFNPATLHAVCRGHQTVEMVRRAFEAGHAVPQLQLNLDLIAPLPQETAETFLSGLRLAFEMEPHQIVLYVYQPENGRRLGIEPAKDFTWPQAEAIFRDEVERHGYRIHVTGGPSIAANHPAGPGFQEHYSQHTPEPSSMLGLGPFAESRVFGVGMYKARGPGAAGSRYVGSRIPMRRLAESYLRTNLLDGEPISRSLFQRAFGERLDDVCAPELAYLEESGFITSEGDTLVPRRGCREEAGRLSWMLLDGEARSLVRASAIDERSPGESVGEASTFLEAVSGLSGRESHLRLTSGELRWSGLGAEALVHRGRLVETRLGGVPGLEAAFDDRDVRVIEASLDRLRVAVVPGPSEEAHRHLGVLAGQLGCGLLRLLRVQSRRPVRGPASIAFSAAFLGPSGSGVDALVSLAGVGAEWLPGGSSQDHVREVSLVLGEDGAATWTLAWHLDPSRSAPWRILQRATPRLLFPVGGGGLSLGFEVRLAGPARGIGDLVVDGMTPAVSDALRQGLVEILPGFGPALQAAGLGDAMPRTLRIPSALDGRSVPAWPTAVVSMAQRPPRRAGPDRLGMPA